jgi:hypothetical protein
MASTLSDRIDDVLSRSAGGALAKRVEGVMEKAANPQSAPPDSSATDKPGFMDGLSAWVQQNPQHAGAMIGALLGGGVGSQTDTGVAGTLAGAGGGAALGHIVGGMMGKPAPGSDEDTRRPPPPEPTTLDKAWSLGKTVVGTPAGMALDNPWKTMGGSAALMTGTNALRRTALEDWQSQQGVRGGLHKYFAGRDDAIATMARGNKGRVGGLRSLFGQLLGGTKVARGNAQYGSDFFGLPGAGVRKYIGWREKLRRGVDSGRDVMTDEQRAYASAAGRKEVAGTGAKAQAAPIPSSMALAGPLPESRQLPQRTPSGAEAYMNRKLSSQAKVLSDSYPSMPIDRAKKWLATIPDPAQRTAAVRRLISAAKSQAPVPSADRAWLSQVRDSTTAKKLKIWGPQGRASLAKHLRAARGAASKAGPFTRGRNVALLTQVLKKLRYIK